METKICQSIKPISYRCGGGEVQKYAEVPQAGGTQALSIRFAS